MPPVSISAPAMPAGPAPTTTARRFAPRSAGIGAWSSLPARGFSAQATRSIAPLTHQLQLVQGLMAWRFPAAALFGQAGSANEGRPGRIAAGLPGGGRRVLLLDRGQGPAVQQRGERDEEEHEREAQQRR